MVGWGNDDGFTGKRVGNTVGFTITDDLEAAYAMIERIAEVGDMGYSGTATGTIDDNVRARLWSRTRVVPGGRHHASGR